jgi:hypothetical protein
MASGLPEGLDPLRALEGVQLLSVRISPRNSNVLPSDLVVIL